jgi:hypothetical protein
VVAGIHENLLKLYEKDCNDYGQVNHDLLLPFRVLYCQISKMLHSTLKSQFKKQSCREIIHKLFSSAMNVTNVDKRNYLLSVKSCKLAAIFSAQGVQVVGRKFGQVTQIV